MGRTRTRAKNNGPAVSSAPSVPSLLEKAQELIIQCDYELAQRFVQRVIDKEPTNVEAREMMGVVSLEMGEVKDARSIFMSLIPPSPSAPTPPPPSAYLYLAQITDDDPKTALAYYQNAIDVQLMQLKGKERATQDNVNDENELKNNIVRTFVGMVEIWMDPNYDLCFDPSAEKTCEELLNQALQLSPKNPEALQSLASVRLSQSRPDEAKDALSLSYIAWKDLDPSDSSVPPIPTCLALAKLFIEVGMFRDALGVLNGVMANDDQEVEAWYLEGWCFFLMAEEAKTGGVEVKEKVDEIPWEDLAKDARDCLETCQMLFTNQGHPDTPLLEHVRELIALLDSLGIKPSPEDEGDDEVWQDEDDEDSDGDDVDMS